MTLRFALSCTIYMKTTLQGQAGLGRGRNGRAGANRSGWGQTGQGRVGSDRAGQGRVTQGTVGSDRPHGADSPGLLADRCTDTCTLLQWQLYKKAGALEGGQCTVTQDRHTKKLLYQYRVASVQSDIRMNRQQLQVRRQLRSQPALRSMFSPLSCPFS